MIKDQSRVRFAQEDSSLVLPGTFYKRWMKYRVRGTVFID